MKVQDVWKGGGDCIHPDLLEASSNSLLKPH